MYGKKMLVPKNIFIQILFFHIGQKSYSKTEIVFKKKILKRMWWWCIKLKQIFSFPSLSKRSKNKTKNKTKINSWSFFFFSAKLLQEFMWWYHDMIIISQLFRPFSARLCYLKVWFIFGATAHTKKPYPYNSFFGTFFKISSFHLHKKTCLDDDLIIKIKNKKKMELFEKS